ncbi:MAG: hypothetical protein AAF609_12455, partial [Cyanobacteria bacterium P01_C01_bin.120]
TNQRKAFRNKVVWTSLGLVIGVGLMWLGSAFELPLLPRHVGSQSLQEKDSFNQGSRQAMSAAELTQTAEFREEWSQVAILWQQAISHMQAVPTSHPSYDVAQQKLSEYARNLQYAQSNVNTRVSSNPGEQSYWTIGSDRELVIAIQGMPLRMSQYSNSCKEVMYYGNSVVELKNGYVVDFSDADGNLSVLGDRQVALSINPSSNTWAIGASQEDVFQVQGTPTRTSTFQEAITLHYDDSVVQLINNSVVSYVNTDNNLKVSMLPAMSATNEAVPATWSLGSSRMEVLQAEQKTPTAVSRLDNNCKEVFNFGDTTVTFRQGLVTEYSRTGASLPLQ